ncbi:MAG: hypothetical protein ABIG87_02305 [Patescibacteria group bacterium]
MIEADELTDVGRPSGSGVIVELAGEKLAGIVLTDVGHPSKSSPKVRVFIPRRVLTPTRFL